MSISEYMKNEGFDPSAKREPTWQGPCSADKQGGITFSLLSRFLVCRERFRIHALEGLRPHDDFNHRLEYGTMWHVCEESFAANPNKGWHSGSPWIEALTTHCKALCKKYPLRQDEIDHWYNVCKVEFPIYCSFWSKQKETAVITPVMQEQEFSVWYPLPSGRLVRLRGKWDAIYHIKGLRLWDRDIPPGIWLGENKTKGEVDKRKIERQLGFDLQTMLYLVALQTEQRRLDDSTVKARMSYREGKYRHYWPILGVRYNVVRRPLSGGKGTIKRHQPSKSNPHGESKESFYNRLAEYIFAEPETYFFRWYSTISEKDVETFQKECFNPILETLVQWYDWITTGSHDALVLARNCHWRHPFGIFNRVDEGMDTEVDGFMKDGTEVGLSRVDNLFPELA